MVESKLNIALWMALSCQDAADRLYNDRTTASDATLQSDDHLASQIATGVELIAPQDACFPPSAGE